MIQDELRQLCRRLLEDGTVQVVIGYGQSSDDGPTYPVFITNAADVDRLVWNDQCFANLTTYLKRKEVKALGKPAIIVKGCDERALVVLEKESQIDRTQMVVIGVACEGVGQPREPKCAACDVHMPRFSDHVIGQVTNAPVEADRRYADLEAFMKKSPVERMAYWMNELSRCFKCYACRATCPMCYCERCIVDKNRPQAIDTSPTLKGNFAWHIARAFHLAGRCVGCDECTRVCPAGIDLRLLNMSLAKAAEVEFGYRAGVDREAEPIIGSYSLKDKESFIR
ncbi:MAG: 4Fe-4S dicluster domain-containing protein [Phycisphaerae bacterium]